MNLNDPCQPPGADAFRPATRFAATVGTFDGVHLGHRLVLNTLREEAAVRGLTPMAITFDAHPLTVIAPERTPKAIMSTHRKIQFLKNEGMAVHLLDFTPATARLSTADWMRDLHDYRRVDCIVIGFDNTFGHDGRSLSVDDYIRLGREIGIDVIVAPQMEGISSSAIRRAIAEGDIEAADRMLGATFTLDGTVEEGDRIGRTLGVPTANMRLNPPSGRILPPFGVYASQTLLPGGRQLPSVTNIGLRPTLDGTVTTPRPRIETHILEFDGNLYGEPIEVALLHFMRPEEKFSDLESLRRRLLEDIRQRETAAYGAPLSTPRRTTTL